MKDVLRVGKIVSAVMVRFAIFGAVIAIGAHEASSTVDWPQGGLPTGGGCGAGLVCAQGGGGASQQFASEACIRGLWAAAGRASWQRLKCEASKGINSTKDCKMKDINRYISANLLGVCRYAAITTDVETVNKMVLEFVGQVQGTILLPSVKRVFVTSQTYDGDLGGWDGAKKICGDEAAHERLPGTYLPWLSDANHSPKALFGRDTGDPYWLFENLGTMKVDKIADSRGDLTDGVLDRAIDLDIAGNPVSGSAWTNTKIDGTKFSSDDCLSWTSSADPTTNLAASLTDVGGSIGDTQQTNSAWTETTGPTGQGLSCASMYHLYCFEQ